MGGSWLGEVEYMTVLLYSNEFPVSECIMCALIEPFQQLH